MGKIEVCEKIGCFFNMKVKNSKVCKKHIILIILAISLALFLTLSYCPIFKSFLYDHLSRNHVSFSSNDPETVLTELVEFIHQDRNSTIFFFFTENNEYVEEGSLRWRNENGYSIWAEGYTTEVRYYVNHSDLSEEMPQILTFKIKLKNILLENSFKLDPENSSEDSNDLQFYDYQTGLTKDNTHCLIEVLGDLSWEEESDRTYQSISISCSNKIEDATLRQEPYLKALEEYWGHSEYNSSSFVSILKEFNSFFLLSVSGERAGYLAIGKLNKGVPEILNTGQDHPSCSKMDNYEIPKEIYENCIEDCDENRDCPLRFN